MKPMQQTVGIKKEYAYSNLMVVDFLFKNKE